VSLLTFGEGYHNYHHRYPGDYRNGARWYNFDPSKWLIFTLELLGLASSLRRSAQAGSWGEV
jgi:stearoyl-CoA desaturase (delta-9 desaturase)